ncbi:MFS transporter [Streptomyces sp. NPDC052727]|uniref:MFS transporter n=1 Tax=unclassified Streptomyces TaxID=2593676 RepID=UPI003426B545
MALKNNTRFRRLGVMYLLLYFGEGLVAIYLFNAIRAAGLTTMNSALVFIATYLPSLLLSRLLATYMTRLGSARVLRISAICRTAACVGFALIPHGASLLYAIGFVVVIEAMWFFMMPAVDTIQEATLAREDLSSGESVLTVVLQISLFSSLFLGGIIADQVGVAALLLIAGALQTGIAALASTGSPAGAAPAADTPATDTDRSRVRVPVPLFVALSLVLALPQLLNILLPLKAFSTYDGSTTLGIIDSMYNLGALVSGLCGAWLLAKVVSPSRAGLIAVLLAVASGTLWVFSASTQVLTDVLAYFVLGLTVSVVRILLRTTVFELAPTGDSGPYFTALTRYSLATSLAGSLLVGAVGNRYDWHIAYIVLPLMCLLSIGLVLSRRKYFAVPPESAEESKV